MNDSTLARLLRHAAGSAVHRGWRCPDAARWVAFVAAEVGDVERAALADHLADCAFCLGQVGFAARTAELGPPPAVPLHLLDAARGVRQRTLQRLRPAVATIAAGAALAVALLVLVPNAALRAPGPRPEAAGDAVRGSGALPLSGRHALPEESALLGAPRLLSPREGEVVTGPLLALRWEAVPEALSYTAQLMNARGDVLAEAASESPRLELPLDAARGAGGLHYVWVVAHHRSGVATRSPAVGFELAPQ